MQPKGKLLIVGGHENKGEIPGENLVVHRRKAAESHFEILSRLVSRIPRAHHAIEIIASASAFPEEMDELYLNAYKREGFTNVGIIKVESAADGLDPVSIERIQHAHAVFFTGGDQNRLVSLLAGTKVMSAIANKYHVDPNFIVGGTSAGAMAIPEIIIGGGVISEALYAGEIKIAKGLDLIRNVMVDTHFVKRGRFARLAHAVALNPSCLGIGLGEDTALIISDGNYAECVGSGMVIIIDGSNITNTNVSNAINLTPIVMDNLKVSIVADGSHYLLSERKIIS